MSNFERGIYRAQRETGGAYQNTLCFHDQTSNLTKEMSLFECINHTSAEEKHEQEQIIQ